MKRFYNDKVSSSVTPSQKRYVGMLSALLRGSTKMSPSPLFLLGVVLHGLPRLSPAGGCQLFLRVYQSLKAVCTSAIYRARGPQTDRISFVLQPAQLVKGDIMVVCYHRNSHSSGRQVVFRVQFHTGVIHGRTLVLPKEDLDGASGDPRFPDAGKVELVFSERPEKTTGGVLRQNDPSVSVDYDTSDPAVRRDSFENVSDQEPARHQGPLDGSLYARARKRSGEDEGSLPALATSPAHLALSTSSDSGFSVASQRTNGAAPASSRRGPFEDERAQLERPVFGAGLEPAGPPPEGMTELPASDGRDGERAERGAGGGDRPANERETDILDDDYDERRGDASPALDRRSLASIGSLSSESLPEALGLVQSEYSTHTWVQQQQMVEGRGQTMETPPLPDTPLRGNSSREAVQRGAEPRGSPDRADGGPPTDTPRPAPSSQTPPLYEEQCKEEELASLASDIDESIEQLNQLILDLDPTFVPVPTRCAPLSRSASLYANGIGRSSPAHRSGWQSRQASDVTDYPRLHSPEWGGAVTFGDPPVFHHQTPPSQHGALFRVNSVDRGGGTPAASSFDAVPSTPAFPVSPPTPYVKSFSEFSHPRPSGQWESDETTLDSRSFLDSVSPRAGSGEGDPYRSEVSGTPLSFQRRYHGSLLSTSSESPLSHPDCSTPPPVWLERNPASPDSSFLSQPSPPLALSSPNAHSSPRGPPRGPEPAAGRKDEDGGEGGLSSLGLGNGSLERSLLETVEGLGGLEGLGEVGLLALPPRNRKGGEGGEFHWHSGSRSPSLSGFSSPRSGSSLSIPFPSSADFLRGTSGTPSPAADLFGSKHDTVKFVQDTSKFWYKPDISRDQAIAVLKDKDPGSFIVRDSHSFRGAYGLAMKVSTPPPSVMQQSKKAGDLSSELVRHFLIECSQKGVRLKGCPNEPHFGSLTALVCQHSITPLALPCKLIIPDGDPLEDVTDSPQSASNSAAELLKQGAACNVWYLGSVELESLTGHQAVQKAATVSLAMDPPPTSTVVHFKVSAQGITLTDNQRKLFFRRHYTVNMVIFCSLDPQDRRWTRDGSASARIFGFVARKAANGTENVCHLFAEHDPEQPASAIVNFVSKVMIGSQKNK